MTLFVQTGLVIASLPFFRNTNVRNCFRHGGKRGEVRRARRRVGAIRDSQLSEIGTQRHQRLPISGKWEHTHFFIIRNFFFYVFSLLSVEQRSEKKFLAHARSNIFLLLLGLNEEGGERIIVGGSLEPVWRTAINCNNPVGSPLGNYS